MTEFDLAVVVCTRNRPSDLEQCLASIAGSNSRVAQVIVSDDSDDGSPSRAVCERFAGTTYLEGPRRGLCANRNNALRRVEARHVLFLDDDARLAPDFVDAMAGRLESSPGRDRMILTGRESRHGEHVTSPHEQSFLGFQAVDYADRDELNTVVINATVFPSRLFGEVGFDESLRYGYDEVDLATRARAAGYRIELVPEAVNEHYPAAANRDEYRSVVDASRLYVTFRRYWSTDRDPLRALAFAAWAPVHLFAAAVKRDGARGVASAASVVRTAAGYIRLGRAHATAPPPLTQR